jgi:hypothetical protein
MNAYRVLDDGQCEICQACVSWLKAFDHQKKSICLPIGADLLPTVDARLNLDECGTAHKNHPDLVLINHPPFRGLG